MTKKQKLELTWIGKENRPRVEPRILLADPDQAYVAKHRITDEDSFDNRLIYGDNLLALKALEQELVGKVKCIYIDPPFNADAATLHYEDNIEHSAWLSLMQSRLEILHRLLSNDGALFVHIDDNEMAYLMILLDEIFGRNNRAYVVTFKQGAPTGHKAINPGCVNTTNFVLIYCKDKSSWTPNKLFTARGRDDRYNQFIVNPDDNYEKWKFATLMSAFASSQRVSDKEARELAKRQPELLDQFVLDNARSVVRLARPDYKNVSGDARQLIDVSLKQKEKVFLLGRDAHSDMYFIKGERILFYKDKLKLIDGEYVSGEPLTTLWDDILSNNLHAEGGVTFPKGKKPEALIKRVLELATNKGDLVLDSFAGSGTTGAVAHKMGRRWIMVELGDHCQTHIVPRMKAVIDGTDLSGITQATSWKGGGGYRYYTLAPSMLEKDAWGNWIISSQYNPAMLAQAMCKHMGFTYEPSPRHFFLHGYSSESDFIYVTTASLTHDQLRSINEQLGENRTLLICCKAFKANLDMFPNLTLVKIPKAVLSRCEWGHDDYSFNVANLELAKLPQEVVQHTQLSLLAAGSHN